MAGYTVFIPEDKNQDTSYNYVVSNLLVQNKKNVLKASAPNISEVTFNRMQIHMGKPDTNAQFIKESKLKVYLHVMERHLLKLGEHINSGCS